MIEKLPPPISVKRTHRFLLHANFYKRVMKEFSKIENSLCKLVEKDVKSLFDDSCLELF